MTLMWGEQVDVRRIHPATSAELEDDDGQISEPRLAAYIAQYATKGTDETEATDTPSAPNSTSPGSRCPSVDGA